MSPTMVEKFATGTSAATKANKPQTQAALRALLMKQNPDGYAKALTALTGVTERQHIESLKARTLIITGEEDRASTPAYCQEMCKAIPKCEKAIILKDVGHWHAFEDEARVSAAIKEFLRSDPGIRIKSHPLERPPMPVFQEDHDPGQRQSSL